MTASRSSQKITTVRRAANDDPNQTQVERERLLIRPALIAPENDAIGPAISRYADLLAQRRQTCQIKVAKPGLLIWADRTLLITAYDELLSCALKYGEPGGKIVFSVRERGSVDELSVWSSIKNVGSGSLGRLCGCAMSGADDMDRHDDPLEMVLARQIVEAHGGRLWAECHPGAWVNFIFTLPKRGTAELIARGWFCMHGSMDMKQE